MPGEARLLHSSFLRIARTAGIVVQGFSISSFSLRLHFSWTQKLRLDLSAGVIGWARQLIFASSLYNRFDTPKGDTIRIEFSPLRAISFLYSSKYLQAYQPTTWLKASSPPFPLCLKLKFSLLPPIQIKNPLTTTLQYHSNIDSPSVIKIRHHQTRSNSAPDEIPTPGIRHTGSANIKGLTWRNPPGTAGRKQGRKEGRKKKNEEKEEKKRRRRLPPCPNLPSSPTINQLPKNHQQPHYHKSPAERSPTIVILPGAKLVTFRTQNSDSAPKKSPHRRTKRTFETCAPLAQL